MDELSDTINDYKDALVYIKNYLGNKKAKIDILGGEPMLYKKWDSIINIIGKLSLQSSANSK